MLDHFVEGFKMFAAHASSAAVIAANALLLALFVLFLFVKNKKPYFFLAGGTVALECAFLYGAELIEAAVLCTALSLALTCILTGVLRFARKEREADDAPVREYVRTLDKKLRIPVETEKPRESALSVSSPRFSSEADVKKSLSLSHARSVIERLNYFKLSAADKNKLNELEFSLASMEKDEVPLSAVNEKLSYLIRMLAKYGA